MNSNAQILLSTKRQNYTDCCYYGSIYLANQEEIFYQSGLNKNTICFMRSLAKPLQASIMCDCNIIDDYCFSDEELAIFIASHAGSSKHIEILKNILKKLNLKTSSLLLMPQNPLDMRNFKGKNTKLHNNCSAKHIMMLSMCKYLGYDYSNYTNENHPIQKLIKEKQEKLSNYKSEILTYDGCSTPLWGLPVENIIRAYFNLFNDKKFKIFINAALKNPDIFGGYNRLDSEIIKLGKNNLFAKVGAGGFVLVYNIKKREILLVKLTQNNNDIRKLITLDILNKLNWLQTDIVEFELNQKNQKVAKYCYEFKL